MADAASKCPACGEKVYTTDDQCMSCGNRLRGAETPPVAPPPAATRPIAPTPVTVRPGVDVPLRQDGQRGLRGLWLSFIGMTSALYILYGVLGLVVVVGGYYGWRWWVVTQYCSDMHGFVERNRGLDDKSGSVLLMVQNGGSSFKRMFDELKDNLSERSDLREKAKAVKPPAPVTELHAALLEALDRGAAADRALEDWVRFSMQEQVTAEDPMATEEEVGKAEATLARGQAAYDESATRYLGLRNAVYRAIEKRRAKIPGTVAVDDKR